MTFFVLAPHLVDIDCVVLLHAPPNDGPQALDCNLVILILFCLLAESIHVRLERQCTEPAVYRARGVDCNGRRWAGA